MDYLIRVKLKDGKEFSGKMQRNISFVAAFRDVIFSSQLAFINSVQLN